MYVHISIHVFMCVYKCMCVYVCMHACICLYVCMYVCISVSNAALNTGQGLICPGRIQRVTNLPSANWVSGTKAVGGDVDGGGCDSGCVLWLW